MLEKIDIELEDATILKLALEAHEKDMKLNDYVLEILRDYLEEISK